MRRLIFAFTIVLLLSATSAMAGAVALEPKPLPPNAVAPHPYMAHNESAVHNDSYNSDVSGTVLPLGIYPEVSAALETETGQTSPAVFFDDDNYAITMYPPGIGIRDFTGDVVTTLGKYIGDEPFSFRMAYAFVDNLGHIVAPTSHGHVMMLRTKDESGAVLGTFEVALDVDVTAEAKKALGEDIDPNLLSVVFDYSGNLWFVTGGYRIYPDRAPAGYLGYISRDYIDAALAGENPDLASGLYLLRLEQGESAENGISANPTGAVILTNLACYMLNASDEGVDILWRTPYDSVGAKDSTPEMETTGGGLTWGSGTSPTLTNDLVLFTDNLDPVNLLALSAETGEVVARTPVLENIEQPVSVDNSIIVYAADDRRTSVLVCNWFGAGNAWLADPEADSSQASYAVLYDAQWVAEGNRWIAPGVERVDFVKTDDGYIAEKVWVREDLRDTSMIKLSTATGYLYGYVQDINTGMWEFIALDWDTGETVLEVPTASFPDFNNMAVGMIIDNHGNTLLCPTNNLDMVKLQDRFAYIAEAPLMALNLNAMERYRISEEELGAQPISFLHKAAAENIPGGATMVFRLTGLPEDTTGIALYAQTVDGAYVPAEWTSARDGDITEVHVYIEDGSELDLDLTEKNIQATVVLAKPSDAGAIGPENIVPENAYISPGEAVTHSDVYNSDVTNAPGAMGIDMELRFTEPENYSTPLIFTDESNNRIVPYGSGIAVRDYSGEETVNLGSFQPEGYTLQISYLYIDANGNVVSPTNDGRLVILRVKDESGAILEQFEMIADIPVVALAKAYLGEDVDNNLLSVIPDYDGNIWFGSGGICVYPDDYPNGFAGYIEKDCVETILSDDAPEDFGEYLYFTRFTGREELPGEAVENGISASEEGVVMLTNQACYLLRASDSGVEQIWRQTYPSNGKRLPSPDKPITGGGLAWGSGTTPTLANDLVIFTDNIDPTSVLALKRDTGEIVASAEIFTDLPEGTQISIDNSIIVYGPDPDTTIVVAGNTFGLGNPMQKTGRTGGDVQTAAGIFDQNLTQLGNEYVEPGITRVDILRENGDYSAHVIWTRPDIYNTSVIRLSTATQMLYFYDQELESGIWRFHALSLATGETLFILPVGDDLLQNNIGRAAMADLHGNELLISAMDNRLYSVSDRFAHLADHPEIALDIKLMRRYRPEIDEGIGYLTSSAIPAEYVGEDMTFLMNSLSGKPSALYAKTPEGYVALEDWRILGENGEDVSGKALIAGQLYTVIVGDYADSLLETGVEYAVLAVQLAGK